MTVEKNRIINQHILKTYKMCEIKSFPFDSQKVLKAYGYDCKAYSSLSEKKRNICLNVSNDACVMNGIVYYNDTALKDRIPFTLMHELAHLLLKHSEKTPTEENEADYFASCILAPRIMIHQLCLTSEYKKVTADDIRDYFGITISASNNALINYHKWYSEIARTTRKPSDVELAIKDLFVEKKKTAKCKTVKQNTTTKYRYLLDPSNDDYFIREMERRRTEPY